MADDREPPALFHDDADKQETKSAEAEDTNPFNVGETTEITLDDDDVSGVESSAVDDKEFDDSTEDEKTGLPSTEGAASVDVINLSKPSEDETELPSKEKPEVCFYFLQLLFVKQARCVFMTKASFFNT